MYILYYMTKVKIRVAIAALFFSWFFLPNKNALIPPRGTRTENTISAVPPCLPEDRPLAPVPTHRLPRNAGNASKDTQGLPFSLCPRRPICCPAFRSALSNPELSVDALAVLLPPRRFLVLSVFVIKLQICPFVKNFFPRTAETVAITPIPW